VLGDCNDVSSSIFIHGCIGFLIFSFLMSRFMLTINWLIFELDNKSELISSVFVHADGAALSSQSSDWCLSLSSWGQGGKCFT
jgi:hypothetical protein